MSYKLKKLFFVLAFAVLLLGCAGLDKPIKENKVAVNGNSIASQESGSLADEVQGDEVASSDAIATDSKPGANDFLIKGKALEKPEKTGASTAVEPGNPGWCNPGEEVQLKGSGLMVMGFEDFGQEKLSGSICHLAGEGEVLNYDYYYDQTALSNLKGEGTDAGSGCIVLTNKEDPNDAQETCFGDEVSAN